MDERIQPSRVARKVNNEEDIDGDTDGTQERLRELLGSDSDDDMDYTPNLMEHGLSDSDFEDKKYKKKGVKPTALSDDIQLGTKGSVREDLKDDEKVTGDKNREDNDTSDESITFSKSDRNYKSKMNENRKFVKIKKRPCGQIGGELYVRDLNRLPTELKKNMDRLYQQKNRKEDGAIKLKKGVWVAQKDQVLQELHRLASQEDPEIACNLLVEVMTRPNTFWKDENWPPSWNYDIEEVGLVCVQILERLIISKTLFLEVILKVGKISSQWRFKDGNLAKKRAFVPKTMTKCAKILLEEGDVDGLEELFSDFRSNLKNVAGEKDLVLYRCVSAMLEKKKLDEDGISLGGTSLGTSFKSVALPPDTLISEVRTALKDKREVDWLMPFFSWYVMDEKSADDVKDLLTEYRNENMDHLPAHQHLLDFLFQEYEEETEILLEELGKFYDEFPWDEMVLTYCKLLIKKAEDDDLDDSFNSKEDDDGENNRKEDKIEIYRTVFKITVKFLDYEMNKDNKVCWDLLAGALKTLCTSSKEMSYMSVNPWLAAAFEDRGGWWMDQNYPHSGQTNTDILLNKAYVAACLYGKKHQKVLDIMLVLQQTIQSFQSSTLNTLLKELEISVQALGEPCLEPFQEDWSGVDRNWNKREWSKIKKIETSIQAERNKTYYS